MGIAAPHLSLTITVLSSDFSLLRRTCCAGLYPHAPERGDVMPKYLVQGSYTDQGLKGLLKEGGSKRRAMVEQLAKEMGGKLETFYYAFGGDDFVIILDLPSNM